MKDKILQLVFWICMMSAGQVAAMVVIDVDFSTTEKTGSRQIGHSAKGSLCYLLSMIEKEPLSDQRIIDCLTTDYGIKVATLTFLPLGADVNASVYKAEAHDQGSYFIKLKRGHHHDISATILALLHDDGIQQIISPLKTNRDQPTQHIDDFTLIVFPFVEGQDGFTRDLTDDQWIALGKVMRQIHEINVSSSIQGKIRRENYSPKWRYAVRSLYIHIESEPSIDDISLKFMTFMKNHAATIHRLIDRAEQLSQQIQVQVPEFVLCHSDIHGGNVLMDGNDTFYIVDWDDPIMAPKERDLMLSGSRKSGRYISLK